MKKLIAVLMISFSLTAQAHDGGGWHGGGWHGEGWRGGGWRGEGWRGEGWGGEGWDGDRALWLGAGFIGGLAYPGVYAPPVYVVPAPPVYVAPAPPVQVAPAAVPGRIVYGPTTYYNGYGPDSDR